jgi:hypothetical protein
MAEKLDVVSVRVPTEMMRGCVKKRRAAPRTAFPALERTVILPARPPRVKLLRNLV